MLAPLVHRRGLIIALEKPALGRVWHHIFPCQHCVALSGWCVAARHRLRLTVRRPHTALCSATARNHAAVWLRTAPALLVACVRIAWADALVFAAPQLFLIAPNFACVAVVIGHGRRGCCADALVLAAPRLLLAAPHLACIAVVFRGGRRRDSTAGHGVCLPISWTHAALRTTTTRHHAAVRLGAAQSLLVA